MTRYVVRARAALIWREVITMTRYVVRVTTNGGTFRTLGDFGPFTDLRKAEEVVQIVCARPDVVEALICVVEKSNEQTS